MSQQITSTINELYADSKFDQIKMVKGLAKSMLRPMQPMDFKDAYLSITREQGEDLVQMITNNNLKSIVEFGTSFGISTLFLAQASFITGGSVVTTELIKSKAIKAIENFKKAGINELIEVRVGDAMETLKNYNEPIDLLLLDGWKDLYLPLFQLLEPNFHKNTIIYVDNADMEESQRFLRTISMNGKYQMETKFGGKAVVIYSKKYKL
jgi:predicted O-methyltransferase YrrM